MPTTFPGYLNLAERVTVNHFVGGSNPPPGAKGKIMNEREIIRTKQAKAV